MKLSNLQEFHILNYIDFKRQELKKDGTRRTSESTLNLNVTAILFTLKHAGYLKYLYPLKSPKYYLYGGEENVKN